jgi:acetoacetyl-CoA reductase
MASIARSIVGRESCSSSCSENQRSVIVPSFDADQPWIVTETRRALVTGAARGIGAAIAQRLAADGLEVLTLDLREGCDIALDVARDQFPALDDIDVCVANAGVTTTIAPAHRMTAEQWQLDIDVNLTGAFRTVQACIRGMRERRHGRIVVISSVAAVGGLPGQVAYAASKSGQLGMVRTLASENAAHAITVNAILPGLVATEQVLAMPPEIQQRVLRLTPTGRMIEPGEIAAAVAFLAGPEAAQITGQAIAVDGGASLARVSLGSERG